MPDWRKAPLSIWDSWEATARWVLAQAPAEKFALAGLSLGGMIAVEMMQIAAERVTDSRCSTPACEPRAPPSRRSAAAASAWPTRAISRLVLGLQMSRFIPAYRLPDKPLVDEVMAMCGEIGLEIYQRQEAMAGVRVDRRPDLPKINCPTIVVCGRDDAATPLFLSQEITAGDPRQRADRDRAVRPSGHDGKAGRDECDPAEVAR